MKNEIQFSRFEKWFQFVDAELDIYLMSYKLLGGLYTRQKTGLIYSRIDLIRQISKRSGEESIACLDQAIVLLRSKALIQFERISPIRTRIMISTLGISSYDSLRKLLNEN